MCSSAFQDLYHLRLLLIIVCVQNAKSSKHVIDIKLEINKKTLLSSFLRYIEFVSYKFKQQHCNLIFHKAKPSSYRSLELSTKH